MRLRVLGTPIIVCISCQPPCLPTLFTLQDLKKQSNQQIREVSLTQSEAVQRLTEGAEKREAALKVRLGSRGDQGEGGQLLGGQINITSARST